MELKENLLVADRFQLVRMIGRGGMGSVWQAMDTRLSNACAVKFIEGELANIADAHARFEREAKAAAQLRSPHVVEIKDYGVWEGRPYIAMELLEGEDLGKALQKAGGKLPPAQVNVVIQQVARALHKAHAAGIVHRDLKPDNIFLVTDDDRQLVKILDFGVAKQTSQAIDGSNTKTGAMLGTPYYMSPEQAQGIKSVDARSDLWSLAVIVYHCLTGRLPFESEALGDLLVKIIVNPVPVPSTVAPVPPGFDRWWAKAASRNPDHRFPSAKDFASALELALGSSSVTEVGVRPQFQGTAMMAQNPAQAMPFQQTPAPYAPYATPPQQQFHGTPHPGQPTPAGMTTPHPALAGSSGPATFSGVEPGAGVPKKGPPIGLIAGILAGVVVLGGVGLFVAKSQTGGTAGGGSASAPVAAGTASAPPVASSTAQVPPPESATAVASADPPPVESAAPAGSTAPAGSAVAARPQAPLGGTRPQVPSAKPSAHAAPSASAPRWNPGF